MRDPRQRLGDILEAIGNVERYAMRGRQAFEEDELIQNWFVHHSKLLVKHRVPCQRRSVLMPQKFLGKR